MKVVGGVDLCWSDWIKVGVVWVNRKVVRVAMWALLFLGPWHTPVNGKKMSEHWREEAGATTHTLVHIVSNTLCFIFKNYIWTWFLISQTACLLWLSPIPTPHWTHTHPHTNSFPWWGIPNRPQWNIAQACWFSLTGVRHFFSLFSQEREQAPVTPHVWLWWNFSWPFFPLSSASPLKLTTILCCCLHPQRSVRTMAEYTLSTTTHGQRSGTIRGPKGETVSQKEY